MVQLRMRGKGEHLCDGVREVFCQVHEAKPRKEAVDKERTLAWRDWQWKPGYVKEDLFK